MTVSKFLTPPAWRNRISLEGAIAVLSLVAIIIYSFEWLLPPPSNPWPLYIALVLGGGPLCFQVSAKIIKGEFGSDVLALVSIVTSVLLGEYIAGTLVVLMLSGGEALERFAVGRASSALTALAKRLPSRAHRESAEGLQEIQLSDVVIGDSLVVLPHEIVPSDGEVVRGHTTMDESFLTGEPFLISKTPGSEVISGAINGMSAVTIRVTKLPIDSRYHKIMEVMRRAEKERPRMRRLGDQLGALYTPVALAIAAGAWWWSGDPLRFLAVTVVATPCPLLIAIPVAIIGTISLAALRGIIVKDPAILERINECKTLILDKTGTLTYGEPSVTSIHPLSDIPPAEILQLAASVEQYSRHPLAGAVLRAAQDRNVPLLVSDQVSEKPGSGLSGTVAGRSVLLTGRSKLSESARTSLDALLPPTSGLECIVLVNGITVGVIQFHDAPRVESKSFVAHLAPLHEINRTIIVSGDRSSEVEYLARQVGISESYASTSPEEKVTHVRRENSKAKTIFVGDGINDAPALAAAHVGIAFGQSGDIAAEAAGAVILESSLRKVDELFHLSLRLRRIALESALGGILLSCIGMAVAALGFITPVTGALLQEVIDLLAVLNALRAGTLPRTLTDFH